MRLLHPFLVAGLSMCALGAPASTVAPTLQEQQRKEAFLGVELEDGSAGHVTISRIVPGSSAEGVCLRVGDRIFGIDGTVTESSADVIAVLRSHLEGDRVRIVFGRGKELFVREVTLGARDEPTSRGGRRDASAVFGFLQLEPGQVVADIGCGTGWLTLAAAERVGEEGRVYAVEINESYVEQMRRRRIANVKAVHSKSDDVALPEGVLDVAVLHDVASHVKKQSRPAFYASVAFALREGGHLVVFGPHGKARAMLDELRKYGFRAENEAELDAMNRKELDARLRQGIRFDYEKRPTGALPR